MGEYDPFDRSDLKNQPEHDQRQPAKHDDAVGRGHSKDDEKHVRSREPQAGGVGPNGGLSHGSQPKL